MLILYQSVHEGRIYQLKLFCDKDYPEKPPSVRFHTRVNMTCVNPESGVVIFLWTFCLMDVEIYAYLIHAFLGSCLRLMYNEISNQRLDA